ncbi:hypothetical protein HDU98_008751 [Podochytrium sp. JEL0797]|nr:hypothetical protein HDU98_008751 [Podochytrium sp. JEL0797]
MKPLTFSNIIWVNAITLTVTPIISLFAFAFVPLQTATLSFAIFYYFFSGMGVTTGYHRYWSHRSYEASRIWQIVCLLACTGAVQGSAKWWCHGHRIHHRFTDTEKDPYNAKRGFFWSHIGWLIFREESNVKIDVSDLTADPLIRFQDRYYEPLAIFMAFGFPAIVAGLGWGDWIGGLLFAGVARLVFLHHSTFCINSLAHYYGDHTFDDKRTPRDNWFTALITFGEGYHNFHHEFPGDYRNAIKFYQYDPTKWLIWFGSLVGLTSDLKVFPTNEIEKGKLYMRQKKIDAVKKTLDYGVPLGKLPLMTFQQVRETISKTGRQLLIVSDVVYDVSRFMDDHPGGRGFLKVSIGRDVTESFNGGVYDHANAARNLMSGMRVFPSIATHLCTTFKGLYPLDAAPKGLTAYHLGITHPTRFVMKAQRKGGGNNIYGLNVCATLKRLTPDERNAYILMDLIQPPQSTKVLVRNGVIAECEVVSELRVFEVWISEGGVVHVNEAAGHLLRTKVAENHEGGVAAGYSVLDSRNLV